MSMFIVDVKTIDALVWFAGKCELIEGMSPTETGKMLWTENLEACFVRYPDTLEGRDRPAAVSFKGKQTISGYRYRKPSEEYSPSRIWGAAVCLGYQCDERSEYESSPTHALLKKIAHTCQKMGATKYDGWEIR